MKMTMKELPESEQPYKKCERFGVSCLSDAELLAVLLKNGTKQMRSTELALLVLNANKAKKGLAGVARLSREELIKIPGIGQVKAIQILCAVELSIRMSKETIEEGTVLSSPSAIAAYHMQELRREKVEHAIVLFFDTKCRLLGEKWMTKGTVNASLLSPREIFLEALHFDAVQITLVHNHPSGNPEPSREDIIITQKIQEAGRIMGISLMDHIIIGDNQYVSLMEQGLLV